LLRGRLATNVSKHGTYNLAKCIAEITAATNADNRQNFFNEVLFLLDGSPTPDGVADLRQVQLSLLISGDLCRMIDVQAMTAATDKLRDIYLQYFESASEDLKHAASYALGNASVGAPSTFLPAIVSKLTESNKKQHYLLLSALREYIQCCSRKSNTAGVAEVLSVIVPALENHCSVEEEGVRTMVAECLGSLACLHPQIMLPKLEQLQNSHAAIKVNNAAVVEEEDGESKVNARVCWTVATSIKLAVASKVDSAELSIYMPSYLKLLQVQELHCRNAALLMVYSALHHMPHVVSGFMKESILPSLFELAELKLERSVNLGPFTHKIDDAVPLRKAALSIFATCLEHLPGSLDIPSFMPILAKTLNDAEDIQLHAHQVLISMCARQPTYVVAAVDTFVEPLEKTLKKSQGQKSGTELERFNDWIKSALRVILALNRLDGAMNSRKFADFVDRVKNDSSSKYRPILQSLEEEQ
jgi:cullin-associated NEDD8-dissociated protein 1